MHRDFVASTVSKAPASRYSTLNIRDAPEFLLQIPTTSTATRLDELQCARGKVYVFSGLSTNLHFGEVL